MEELVNNPEIVAAVVGAIGAIGTAAAVGIRKGLKKVAATASSETRELFESVQTSMDKGFDTIIEQYKECRAEVRELNQYIRENLGG